MATVSHCSVEGSTAVASLDDHSTALAEVLCPAPPAMSHTVLCCAALGCRRRHTLRLPCAAAPLPLPPPATHGLVVCCLTLRHTQCTESSNHSRMHVRTCAHICTQAQARTHTCGHVHACTLEFLHFCNSRQLLQLPSSCFHFTFATLGNSCNFLLHVFTSLLHAHQRMHTRMHVLV